MNINAKIQEVRELIANTKDEVSLMQLRQILVELIAAQIYMESVNYD